MLLLLACAPATIDTKDPASSTDPNAPTWHQDIAPIIAAHCDGCHTAAGPGPFDLTNYSTASSLANTLVDAVDGERMPPWGAIETDECQPRFGWKDDLRLSEDEKQLLRDWAAAGAPEGDAESAATLPEAPSLELEGANQTLKPAGAYFTSGERDQLRCFTLDPELEKDTWLTGMQVIPGNPRVVHHVLVFSDPNGESAALAGSDGSYDCSGGANVSNAGLIMAWVPGATPYQTPTGSAMQVTKGSRLVMQIHYHPAGGAEDDQTSLNLRWSSSTPSSYAFLSLQGNAYSAASGLLPDPDDRGFVEFRIPANSTSHTETMDIPLPGDLPEVSVFMVGTHMHYVGVDMRISVTHANPTGDQPTDECMLETPRWDFNWQRAYSYDTEVGEGVRVRGGDVLHLSCTYNNTVDNPGVQQALTDENASKPSDVYLGEETLDEMCLGIFGVVYKPF